MTPDLDREQEAAAPIAVVSHDGQDFRFTHDDPADHIFSILKRTGAFYEGDMLREMAALLHTDELVLDVGDGLIRLDTPVADSVLDAIGAVRRDLAQHGIAWSEIDARFGAWVVVRNDQ